MIRKYAGTIRRYIYGKRDEIIYNAWLKRRDVQDKSPNLAWQPLVSIIVPTYNTDLVFLDKMIQSVINQTYFNWELVIIDDRSPNKAVRDKITEYTKRDSRITKLFLKTNHHIAGATNEGIRIAKGEFIGLLDHDDILDRHALTEVVIALNNNNALDFIYTDEDKIVGTKREQPFFKTDLNIDLLHSVNYITHFAVMRKTVLDKYGYENKEYNGAQDWELFLRIIRNIPKDRVCHIPKILYSWRVHELSTSKDMGVKPYVIEAQEKAIRDDLKARGVKQYHLSLNAKYNGQWKLTYPQAPDAKILIVSRVSDIWKHDLTMYDFVSIVSDKGNNLANVQSKGLISESARKEIAIAFTGTQEYVFDNLKTVLQVPIVGLIRRFTHISVSRHLYTTTRYNLSEVRSFKVATVEVKKIRELKEKPANIRDLSSALHAQGYEHLYIPAVDLL